MHCVGRIAAKHEADAGSGGSNGVDVSKAALRGRMTVWLLSGVSSRAARGRSASR
jgi:hypothetical protein